MSKIDKLHHQQAHNKNNKNKYFVLIADITKKDDIFNLEQFLHKLLQFDTIQQKYHNLYTRKQRDELISKQIKYQLWGVINNAGIMKCGEIDIMSLDDFRKCLDVNCLGSIAVTKCCLKYLKYYDNSRILTITSAVTECPMYGYGCYATSKCGLEAFSIVLDKEYGKEYFEESMKTLTSGYEFSKNRSYQIVTNAIFDGLLRNKPYFRYHVTNDGKSLQFLGYYFPLWIQEFLVTFSLKPKIKPRLMQIK